MDHEHQHHGYRPMKKRMADIAPRRRQHSTHQPHRLHERKRQSLQSEDVVEQTLDEERLLSQHRETRAIERDDRRVRRAQRAIWTLIIIGIIAVAGYFVTRYFVTVTIKVTTTSLTVPIEYTGTASKASPEPTPLLFATASRETSKEIFLPATSEQYREAYASGTVRMMNSFSTLPQTLVANTRLRAQGKEFLLKETVTIPGMKGATPGSVDVFVTAIAPGEEYNIGHQDFSVPAFAKTKKEATIIGRSVTPIEGGWKGSAPDVPRAQIDEARTQVLRESKEQAIHTIREQTPARFVLLDGGFIIHDENVYESLEKDGVRITAEISGEYVLFDEVVLTEHLAKQFLKGKKLEKGRIRGSFEDLVLRIETQPGKNVSDHLTVAFSGKATFSAIIDTLPLKNALANTSRFTLGQEFQRHPDIVKADVYFSPLWVVRFPNDPSKISVEQ